MPLVDENSPQVRFPPPLIFVGGLLLGLLADEVLALPRIGADWAATLGWGLVIGGGAFIGASLGWFIKAGTDPEPWKKDTALVTTGLYRVTRNPMYLGMALAGIGVALVLGSYGALAGTVLAVLLVDRLVIAREERHLNRIFGHGYESYRKRVRRWF